MRILICDDNRFVIDELKQYLEEYFTQNHYPLPELVSYSDGDSLLADQGKKDIVFLDIEMPGSNGIHVSSELKKTYPNVLILITTSYEQYLDDAMGVQVFRYLSKPLEKKRLFRNLNDAMHAYLRLVSTVIIDDGKASVKISEAEIIYIEAQERISLVHTISGIYSDKRTMQSWRNTLNADSFFQTHKSYIVNMKHVLCYDHQLISFISCQDHAYLSRRKYKEFKRAYLFYIGHNR